MMRPHRNDPATGAGRRSSTIDPPTPFDLASAFDFDLERCRRLLRRLAFPRAVGSSGERLAARLVLRALDRSGRPAVRERFPVGRAARRYGSLFAFLGAAVLVALGCSASGEWPIVAGLLAASAGALVNAPWLVTRSLADRWRPRAWSENLVSWPGPGPGASGEGWPRVVFLAHYDSKSQRLPTGVRVGLVVSSTVGCAALAVMAAVGVGPIASLSGAVVACLVGLMLNASGNRSPGALDNGSGLAVLLELARSWRGSDDRPAEVVFLATGAEEVGLDGARAFLQRHEWWLRERPTLLINLESVGSGRRVLLSGSSSAEAMATREAARLGIPTGRFRVLGAGMDHQPFSAAGLEAVSLLGDVVGTSGALHSPRDGLHLIDPGAMLRAARLAAALADAWAGAHRPGGVRLASPAAPR